MRMMLDQELDEERSHFGGNLYKDGNMYDPEQIVLRTINIWLYYFKFNDIPFVIQNNLCRDKKNIMTLQRTVNKKHMEKLVENAVLLGEQIMLI